MEEERVEAEVVEGQSTVTNGGTVGNIPMRRAGTVEERYVRNLLRTYHVEDDIGVLGHRRLEVLNEVS